MSYPTSIKYWTKYVKSTSLLGDLQTIPTEIKQSSKLNAEHKGLDTPSEDDDAPHKQNTGEQKKFPQEVKTVNLLHVTKGKSRTAPTKTRAVQPAPEEQPH